MTNESRAVQTYEGKLLRHGSTAERLEMTARLGPGGTKIPNGWMYYDIDLTKPVWWDRNTWKLADGSDAELN